MSELRKLDTNPIPDVDEIRLFAKVRNEAAKIPFFVSYYRDLGISRFFFIDNGSSDCTVNLLKKNSDVHVFATLERMSEARAGMDWIEPLLHRYGLNRWCIVADADELLVYPASEEIPLRRFCQDLDGMGASAFACILLDMYPGGNIADMTYTPDQSFIDACPFFDSSGYRWISSGADGPSVIGGPRLRMFYPELLEGIRGRILRRINTYRGRPSESPPFLNKIPLVRWGSQMRYSSAAHYLSGANLASGHGALLHFKFLGDFAQRVEEELVRKAYHNGGQEYRRYFERTRKRSIRFKCRTSVEFNDSKQLLDLGLIKCIGRPEWRC